MLVVCKIIVDALHCNAYIRDAEVRFSVPLVRNDLSSTMQKLPSRYMQIMKTQISMCIITSRPVIFVLRAHRIRGYGGMAPYML